VKLGGDFTAQQAARVVTGAIEEVGRLAFATFSPALQ